MRTIPKRMNFMTHDNERPNLREPLLHCRQVDCRSMLGSGCSHAACIPPASRHAWLMKTIHDTNHHCEGRFMPSEIGVFDT
jgi:hypothetical protein